ncbi:MAG: methionyl-tRNA formyltransferase [Dehalococcoidia bacterium]
MRIVFMGTPEFSVPALKKLIASEHDIIAVYTQMDKPAGRGKAPTPPPVKKVAEENGLTVFQPKSLRDEAGRLRSLAPDIIVVAAFGQILPQSVLDIPGLGGLNIHPSLLPKYRGASPIASAILSGNEETGVTIMLMDTGMDTGPILAQRRIPIDSEDTAESLEGKLAEAGAELLMKALPEWAEGRITPQPQRDEEANYTSPLSKADGKMDWNLSAGELWRRVRALYPWPGCYTRWQGKMLKVLDAVPVPSTEGASPGVVVSLPDGAPAPVGVGTGEGILGLRRIQLEGKKAMSANDFLRGQRGFIGAKLG